MKPNILYYSDCPFFAGCENMIANFLTDQEIQDNFSVSFAYNFSEKYEKGLNFRVPVVTYTKYPVKLVKPISYNKPQNISLIYSIAHKVFFAFYIPLFKYISIFINTIHLFIFFKKHKIDILHINNGGYPAAGSCTSAVIAAKLVGIKRIIYVVNNMADDYRHPFRWLDYPIDLCIKRWVTVFVTGSDHAGRRLSKVLNLNKEKQITINNGIQKRAITLSKDEFKEKYLVPKNKIVVSVVANLEKRKGHIYLFEAVLQIKNKLHNNKMPLFIIEGIGPEKDYLHNYILEHELTDDIIMIDYIPDIYNLLNASDFVILPSIENEDFPNVTLEAMSLGKPLIGTEIAGIPEQIVHNKTGIIVKPKNALELSTAIIELVTNQSIFKIFSEEALIRFNTLFEKKISIEKYIKLYNLLIKNYTK